jgi:hypothetical protein
LGVLHYSNETDRTRATTREREEPQEKEDNRQQPLQPIRIALKAKKKQPRRLAWEERRAWMFREEEGQAGVDFERHEVDNEPEHLDGSTEGVNKYQVETTRLLITG